MPKLFFSPDLCTGCRACELACSFTCEGIFSPARSRIRIVRIDCDGIDIPVGCEHCEDAPCRAVCPVRAISRDALTGAMILDTTVCIGCKQCMVSCPFGAISFDAERRILYKCDLCHGDPECVKWCFTEALKVASEEDDYSAQKRRKHAVRMARAASETRKLIPG